MTETPKIAENILDRLEGAPYGAYGTDLRQTIVFWNAQAELILGYRAKDVIGRKCYEALKVLTLDRATAICSRNCPAIVAANRGRIPPVSQVLMRSSSGQHKRVTTFPLIAVDKSDRPVLVHMFHEDPADVSSTQAPTQIPLTARETEVLSLLAGGRRPLEIAGKLFISVHTVRKHISNACEKLHAHGMMSAVLAAQRQHLI